MAINSGSRTGKTVYDSGVAMIDNVECIELRHQVFAEVPRVIPLPIPKSVENMNRIFGAAFPGNRDSRSFILG